MKRRRRNRFSLVLACLASLIFLLYSPAYAQPQANPANYGAKAALQDQSLTLSEMLTYSIQDEYLARSRYNAILKKFGERPPFSRIKRAEERHIQALRPLFSKHKVTVPKDTSLLYTAPPVSLKEAFAAGVRGEMDNIAMYDKFLKERNLPQDVKNVFSNLQNASKGHLAAFQAGLNQLRQQQPEDQKQPENQRQPEDKRQPEQPQQTEE